MSKRYGILGAGALGGLYGSLLDKAQFDVSYFVNSDYKHLKEHGWKIESVWGDFQIKEPNVFNSVDDWIPVDVLCIGLKGFHNYLLPELLPKLVRPDGIIILWQNGIGVEEAISEWMPEATILGGLCFLCSNKAGPGHIKHLDYGAIRLGIHTKDRLPIVESEVLIDIAKDLRTAKIPTDIVNDLFLARWQKLCWNIPFNGLSALLDVDTKELVDDPDMVSLATEMMHELQGAVDKWDKELSDAFIKKMIQDTFEMKPYEPSMLLDRRNKRPLELGVIFEQPLKFAAIKGLHLPRIHTLYRQLKFLNEKNLKAN